MITARSAGSDLTSIVRRSAHVLLDFDGPVCAIFGGITAPVVAEQFRTALGRVPISLPPETRDADDPLEVFRQVADLGPEVAETAQRILIRLETRAARAARATQGSSDLMRTAHATGHTVTIVSNNSSAAIAAYLGDHRLTRYVTAVVGRDDADPTLMKPSPYRVRMAVSQLDAKPGDAFFVGDSPSDVVAGKLAGVAVIGFANKPGKASLLDEAGADAVTTRLGEISTALRATPRVALPN
jgi:phosphoglycolate phosphatase-like HAD superfamily hydrolase